MRSIIIQLWRGEATLAVAFWVFGILIPVLFLYLTYDLGDAFMMELWPNLFWHVLIISVGYSIFICVAIWRSASRYIERKQLEVSRVLGYGAKAVVVQTMISNVAMLVEVHMVSRMIEAAKVFAKRDADPRLLTLPHEISPKVNVVGFSKGNDVYRYDHVIEVEAVKAFENYFGKAMLEAHVYKSACQESPILYAIIRLGGSALFVFDDSTGERFAEFPVDASFCVYPSPLVHRLSLMDLNAR